MQFIDQPLVARLESALSALNARFVRSAAEARPGGPWATEPIMGGHAQYGGPAVAPINKAAGVGVSGPVSGPEFERFERFYRSRDAHPVLEVASLADPSLLALLGERGYRIEAFTNVHLRSLAELSAPPEPAHGLTVEQVTTERGLDQFSDTLGRGFMEGARPDPAWRELHAAGVRMPGAISLVVRHGGRAVAAGSMAVLAEAGGRGVAALFGAATLPEFRRRGAQSALLACRLQHALERGCDFAVIHTRPGTTSERNVARFGFRLGYTKVLMRA